MEATKNNTYRIITLGEFKVTKGEEILTVSSASSKKIWELYKFMLTFKDRKFTPESLNDQVWISEAYSDPRGTLRRQMHRMRQILKEDHLPEQEWTIRFENGYYFWNPTLSFELDSEVFEKTLSASNCEQPDDLACCLKALELYRGDYLPDLYEQHWVFGIRNHFRRLYLNALHDAVEQLYEQKEFSQILNLCQQAIQIDNYEERFHIEYMKALTGMGRQREALSHYDQITSFYYKELGLKPSDELKAFYKSITQTGGGEPDSDFIRSLTSRVVYEDAYYCEADVFKAICELEKRRSERDSKQFTIGVLKLVPISTNSMSREQFRIRHLKLHLLSHLRKGDAFTLWNQYQFLILLDNGTEEGVKSMLKRMVSTYEQSQHLSVDYLSQI